MLPALALPAVAEGAVTWTASEPLSVDDGAQYRAPHAARNRGGEVVAAWVRAAGASGTGRVQITSRGTGGRWATTITAPGLGVGAPHAAINARADAAVAWAQAGRIWVAQRGGRRGGWRMVAAARAGGPVRDVATAVNPAGAVMVAWVEAHGDRFRVRTMRRAANSARWLVAPTRLTTPTRPSVAVAPGHTALAVWLEADGVMAARGRAGAFESGRLVAEGRAEAAAVALTDAGAAVGGWNLLLPAGSSVLSVGARAAGAADWSEPTDLGVGGGPVAAINARGDAVVVWDTHGADGRAGLEAAWRRGADGQWENGTVMPRTRCRCTLSATSVAIDRAGATFLSWRRAPAGGATAVGGLTGRRTATERWTHTSLQPVPATGATRVVAGAGTGAMALWAAEGARAGVFARVTGRAGR